MQNLAAAAATVTSATWLSIEKWWQMWKLHMTFRLKDFGTNSRTVEVRKRKCLERQELHISQARTRSVSTKLRTVPTERGVKTASGAKVKTTRRTQS